MSIPPPDPAAASPAADPAPAAVAVAVSTPEPDEGATTAEVVRAPFSRSRSALVFIAVLLAFFTCYLARDLIVPSVSVRSSPKFDAGT